MCFKEVNFDNKMPTLATSLGKHTLATVLPFLVKLAVKLKYGKLVVVEVID